MEKRLLWKAFKDTGPAAAKKITAASDGIKFPARKDCDTELDYVLQALIARIEYIENTTTLLTDMYAHMAEEHEKFKGLLNEMAEEDAQDE